MNYTGAVGAAKEKSASDPDAEEQMKDVFEKYVFEGRVGAIYEGVKARLKPHDDREGTYTGFPDDG